MALFPFASTVNFFRGLQGFEGVAFPPLPNRSPFKGKGDIEKTIRSFNAIPGSRLPRAKARLEPLDTDIGLEKIEFDIPLESLKSDSSQTYAEANSLGRAHPISQWVHGNQVTFAFTAQLYAPTASMSLDRLFSFINSLSNAHKVHPALRRPPIWDFSWGSISFGRVVIRSIGGITINEVSFSVPSTSIDKRSETIEEGTHIKHITFEIELRRYEKFDFRLSDPNARASSTKITLVRRFEHWEHVALRVYRRPSLGEHLRREHPAQPIPLRGAVVFLPDLEEIVDAVIEPESIPLERTPEAIEMRQELFASRGKARFSAVLSAG